MIVVPSNFIPVPEEGVFVHTDGFRPEGGVQTYPVSVIHLFEQPSKGSLFPSSQVSPALS